MVFSTFCFLTNQNLNILNGQTTRYKGKSMKNKSCICACRSFLNEGENPSRRQFFGALKLIFFVVNTVLPLKITHSSSFENKPGKPFFTKTGLKILDFTLGEGQIPKWGDLLIINYVMYLSNGKKLEKIDSTYDRNTPFLFLHGGGQIILGLEEAVHDMKLGGKRRVILPSNLGYSNPGLGPIPPTSGGRKKLFNKAEGNLEGEEKDVIFDIEILSIKESKDSFEWYNTNQLSSNKIQKIFNKKKE
mmetsp:Transcript_51821/g.121667  ORF Transcript_51821/g.121667 Transcript_51821/m.121667 type:complete len:246 (-) Transcript_51821:19-756(-)